MVTLRRAFARCVGPSIRFGCAAAHQLSAPYSRYLDTPIAGDLGDRDTLHLTIDRAAPNSRKREDTVGRQRSVVRIDVFKPKQPTCKCSPLPFFS